MAAGAAEDMRGLNGIQHQEVMEIVRQSIDEAVNRAATAAGAQLNQTSEQLVAEGRRFEQQVSAQRTEQERVLGELSSAQQRIVEQLRLVDEQRQRFEADMTLKERQVTALAAR